VRTPEKGVAYGDTSWTSLEKGSHEETLSRRLRSIKDSKLRRKEEKEERALQCLYPLAPCSFPDCHMLLPSPEFLLAARSSTRDSTCDSTRDSPSRQLPWVACDLHVPSRLQLHACWNSGRCLGLSQIVNKLLCKFVFLQIKFYALAFCLYFTKLK